MEKKLFLLLIFPGIFQLVQSVLQKYYLIQQKKTWSDAQAYCRSTYTDLVTIQTASIMVQLQNEAQRHQFSSSTWTGLWNDINSWRWSFGNEPKEDRNYWCSNEPNNWGGHEECGTVTPWCWNDLPCSVALPFICFDERSTATQRYVYYSAAKTWKAAQTFCRLNHTDLASVRNDAEEINVRETFPVNVSTAWFGLFRDSWKWSDQTNFSPVSWIHGQPDNAMLNEACGFLNNSLFGDAPCSQTMPFFCYSVITGQQQQILRVKVQSDQDVNDPAVKAAIMEQLKQKLKDHEIKDVKLKWRKQPDGVVFHKIENGTMVKNETNEKRDVQVCLP